MRSIKYEPSPAHVISICAHSQAYLRQAKVHKQAPPQLEIVQIITRLNIPMDDTRRVDVRQSFHEAAHVLADVFELHRVHIDLRWEACRVVRYVDRRGRRHAYM